MTVKRRVYPSWPTFAEDEIAAATAVLKSGKVNYWTGEECRKFEQEFAAMVGTDYAVALANGTVALEAALRALDIGPGDDVLVTSRTFIASASCIVACGARPIIADVDPVSQNVTAQTLAAVLTKNTKAIIAVHLAGWPCDMDPIMALAQENNLAVIEDCAQAHGAVYKGRTVGSIGDVAAFSFCQDKIITTGGEGGMVTTNNQVVWEKVWSLKDHGKSQAALTDDGDSGFRWLHDSFGSNFRLTEFQAAIGRCQLKKLPAWLAQRRKNAEILSENFSKHSMLRITVPTEDIKHAYYKYYVFVRPEELKADWDRDRIINALEKEGVPCQSGSCSEIYLEKAFGQELRPKTRLLVAKKLGETSLMFQVHPTLSADDIRSFGEVTDRVLQEAKA